MLAQSKMSSDTKQSQTDRSDVGLALAALSAWVVLNAFRYWNLAALDMTGLYFAARFFSLGQFEHIYSSMTDAFLFRDAPEAWQGLAASLNYPTDQMSDYVYPPLWAAVFAPIAGAVSPFAFLNTALIFLHAVFALGVMAAWHLSLRPIPALHWAGLAIALLELTSVGWLASSLVQPQYFVVGLILIAFALYQQGWAATAGTMIAMAAAIKVTPLFFAVIFLADRNWRAATAFVLAGAALAGGSVLLAGWPMHQEFLSRLDVLQHRVLFSHINLSLIGFASFLQMAWHAEDVWRVFGHAWVDLPGAIKPLSSVLLILTSIAAAAIKLRNTGGQGVALSVLFIGLATTIASPLGWLHYLIILIACAPVVFALFSSRAALVLMLALTLLLNRFMFDAMLSGHIHVSLLYHGALGLVVTGFVAWVGLRRR